MVWFVVMHLFSTLLEWITIGRLSEREKDLEILLLRQQLGIAERKLHKPVRAPNANSIAERWIRSVRAECLDKFIIVNQAHLRSVLCEYVGFFNTCRPHQGIGQQTPIVRLPAKRNGPVQKRTVLGGIIHDYYRKAA